MHKRLSMRLLQKALDGILTVGWYATFRTPVLGIDIDDHRTGGWTYNQRHPLPALREHYEAVVESFPRQPSLVAKSPHGIHVYYLLTERVHIESLHHLAGTMIENASPELKPTPHATLRIPATSRFRHPRSLQPMKEWRDQGVPWERLPRYPISDLFGDEWRDRLPAPGRAATGRPSTDEHRVTLGTERPVLPDLSEVESTVLPFRDGETYEQTFLFAMACRRRGMSVNETIKRALLWLDRSTAYTGSLRASPDELEERIRHIFKIERSEPVITTPDIGGFRPAVERLAKQHPFVPQRTKAIRRFLENLVRLKIYHDAVAANESMLLRYDDKYPFYRLNRSRGVYPLPSNLLKKWNTNYPSILAWLMEIGVLIDPGTSFSPHQRVCKYYGISIAVSPDESESDG